MDLFQKCYDFTQVKEVVEAGIYPYFHALQTGQDTVVTMEGKRTIMIGSNNYLGLTSDPRVKEAAIKAVETYGSGCSGSRFLNGTLELHLELESQLAEFLRKDACITFSTTATSSCPMLISIPYLLRTFLCITIGLMTGSIEMT
jgi:8-amino-7-oxononanoate synthase